MAQELKKQLNFNSKIFNVLNYNIQSLQHKIDQLNLQVIEHNIDIICLTETWLCEGQLEFLNLHNFKIGAHYCRHVNKHGGVLIATKSNYKCTSLKKLTELSIERDAEFAGLYLANIDAVILGLYRSPMGSLDIFFDRLAEVLNCITDDFCDKKIIVAGDFNINFLVDTRLTKSITDLFSSYGLFKVFHDASRVSNSTETCIDNIFLNTNYQNCKTEELHMSDHLAQFISLYVPHLKLKKLLEERLQLERI